MGDDYIGMTIEELASALRCSPNHVRKLIQAKELPARRVGRSWLVHRDVVEAWLKKGCENPAEEEAKGE